VLISSVSYSGVEVAGINNGKYSDKFNMSYIYFGSPSDYIKAVERTRGVLDDIAPTYFDLNPDGSLKLNGINKDVIKSLHNYGLKVTPFLSNHWDRNTGKAALDNKDRLTDQIAEAVEEYDLDGVNIDIENLTSAERNQYTEFVKNLRQKLPSEKSLSVAVAANPWGSDTGWQGSYDYVSLAKYCDYLMVMAYDEHYEGGEPGPVASGEFAEKSVEYALKNTEPGKIVLGIPFYGRCWKAGEEYGGYGISAYHIDKLVKKYSGTVIYDENLKSAKAVFTVKPTDEISVIGSRTFDAGTYTIWFDNYDAVRYKLSLVNKYGLKGTGSWSLGQEPDGIWEYYSLWLNGFPFVDIGDSWAAEEIIAVAEKNIMMGVSGTRFNPKEAMTRAEAAVVIVRVLGLDRQDTGKDPDADKNSDKYKVSDKYKDSDKYSDKNVSFVDIDGHWAENEIKSAAAAGLMKGTGNGRFSPDKKINRAEMAVLLGRVYKQLLLEKAQKAGPTQKYVNSYDVSYNNLPWAYDYIVLMSRSGILIGYPDGGFHPYDTVSREQTAALLYRLDSLNAGI